MPAPSAPFISLGQLLARRLITFGLLGLVLLTPIAYWTVKYTFDDLEVSYASEKLSFIEKFMISEEKNLRIIGFDYGNWQASFESLQGTNPQYYKNDLRRDDLVNVNVQIMGLFNKKGQLKSWAPELTQDQEILEKIQPQLNTLIKEHIENVSHIDLAKLSNNKEKSPFYAWTTVKLVEAKPYPFFIAIAPVLSHDKPQKHGGWLVLVRTIDSTYLNTLFEQVGLPFMLEPQPQHIKSNSIELLNSSIIGMHALSNGSNFAIRLELPHRWEQQRFRMFVTIMLASFTLLSMLMLLGYHLMGGAVLKRLHRLTLQVKDIKLNGRNAPLPLQTKNSDEIDVLAAAINSLVTHISSIHEQLSHEARHDALTGLANRRDLIISLNELQIYMQQGGTHCVGLILMDLNGFKPINDSIGHAAGDAVLQALALRFQELANKELKFFRLGGDEFAVIITHASNSYMEEICERIKEVIRFPITYGEHTLNIDAALGVAFASSAYSWTPDSLLRSADLAMYAQKKPRSPLFT